MSKSELFTEEYLKKILDFKPKESIGQNFLIDYNIASQIASRTIRGADVVEVGSGPGNLTRMIAENGANRVIGLEIDPNFREAQEIVLAGTNNVEIRQQNALNFDFDNWIRNDSYAEHQVIGNIPYHISEPLITAIARSGNKIVNTTLLVGKSLATTLTTTNPGSIHYSKLSFIGSVFDINIEARVSANCFWPRPRTESAVISLSSKEMPTDESQTALELRKAIVDSSDQNLTLAKVINGLSTSSTSGKQLGKDMSHRYGRRQQKNELNFLRRMLNDMPTSRRQNREDVQSIVSSSTQMANSGLAERLGLSTRILSKPFHNLNNEEVKDLERSLMNI